MEKEDKNKDKQAKPVTKDKEKNQNLGNKGSVLDFVRKILQNIIFKKGGIYFLFVDLDWRNR